jgi:hypothetical protein
LFFLDGEGAQGGSFPGNGILFEKIEESEVAKGFGSERAVWSEGFLTYVQGALEKRSGKFPIEDIVIAIEYPEGSEWPRQVRAVRAKKLFADLNGSFIKRLRLFEFSVAMGIGGKRKESATIRGGVAGSQFL